MLAISQKKKLYQIKGGTGKKGNKKGIKKGKKEKWKNGKMEKWKNGKME